jgi:hypothetical protein
MPYVYKLYYPKKKLCSFGSVTTEPGSYKINLRRANMGAAAFTGKNHEISIT